MNPLIFLLLVGGGYYYYKERKKKTAEEKALTEGSCVLVTRHESNLICEGAVCRGITQTPGADQGKFTAYWNNLFERHATAYFGSPPPWNPTLKQAKDVIALGMAEAFPECSWRFMPDSTPMWGATYGQLAQGFVDTAPGLGAAQPPGQLPASTSIDRNGMLLIRQGDVCSRVSVVNENVAMPFWSQLSAVYAAENNPAGTLDDGKALLAFIMAAFFPECPWPPTNQQFRFVGNDGELVSWDQMAIAMQMQIIAMNQGQAAMQPTIGNLGKLGQLALQQGYA